MHSLEDRRPACYIGIATTFHDPAIAIVDRTGKILFAEATERRLQDKRAHEDIAEVETPLFSEAAQSAVDQAKAEAASAKQVEADRRAKALMQGYTGNMCTECSNFTMVRNGTCEKCDTCGSTSGCS